MSNEAVLSAIIVGALAGIAFHLLFRRPRAAAFTTSRGERLARRVCEIAGCALNESQQAVQRELDIAPTQSDEVIVKRAVYHYRRDLPEPYMGGFRDTAPG